MLKFIILTIFFCLIVTNDEHETKCFEEFHSFNLYSVITAICVSNINPDLLLRKTSFLSIKCTESNGSLDIDKINTFPQPYKDAFLQASLLLPNNCSNLELPYYQNYNTDRKTANLLQDNDEYPLVIYNVQNEVQISNTFIITNFIDCENVLKFTTFSGGHDYKSYSSRNNTFVIKTQLLNSIIVNNDNTATVQTGNTNINDYLVLNGYGLVVMTGYSPNIRGGVLAGLGFNPFLRQNGFSIDSVKGIRVVLANGLIVNASSSLNEDLFWGCVGGIYKLKIRWS